MRTFVSTLPLLKNRLERDAKHPISMLPGRMASIFHQKNCWYWTTRALFAA